MTTKTITVTDLADVQPGDLVTADYVPQQSEGAAIISGIAYKCNSGALRLAGMMLRRPDGAHGSFQRFVSATREVPAWAPDEDEVRYLAQALAAPMPETALTDWRAQATHLLTHMHNNGWLNDTPAESEPVDPVLDETDKRDRIDSDGDKWHWSEYYAVWRLRDVAARGNLATIDRHYGPLNFADEEADA